MANIKAHQADRYLASPPDGIRMFLLYGSDPGATTERARLLERLGLQRGRNGAVIRIGSDELASNPGRIADEAFAISLFGGEPVIALRVLDGRHNVLGSLEALLERPLDAAWVIVEAGELTPANPLRKAFEGSPHAAAVPAYPLEGAGLASFIHAAADEAGVTIEPAAGELLAEALGGDRLAARGELEKLFVYVAGHGAVTVADVEAIVGETSEARTDEVIDAALTGESEALEIGLERMRAEAASPAGLAVLTLRHVIQLQSLRLTMDAGATASAALDRARPPVFSRRRSAVEATLRIWPAENLRDARRKIADAILAARLQSNLEGAAVSAALHDIALESRRLKRSAAGR